jgi:hypothetical protein
MDTQIKANSGIAVQQSWAQTIKICQNQQSTANAQQLTHDNQQPKKKQMALDYFDNQHLTLTADTRQSTTNSNLMIDNQYT